MLLFNAKYLEEEVMHLPNHQHDDAPNAHSGQMSPHPLAKQSLLGLRLVVRVVVLLHLIHRIVL